MRGQGRYSGRGRAVQRHFRDDRRRCDDREERREQSQREPERGGEIVQRNENEGRERRESPPVGVRNQQEVNGRELEVFRPWMRSRRVSPPRACLTFQQALLNHRRLRRQIVGSRLEVLRSHELERPVRRWIRRAEMDLPRRGRREFNHLEAQPNVEIDVAQEPARDPEVDQLGARLHERREGFQ